MGFSRREHWSGLPFPSPGDRPDSGIQSFMSLALAGRFFTTSATCGYDRVRETETEGDEDLQTLRLDREQDPREKWPSGASWPGNVCPRMALKSWSRWTQSSQRRQETCHLSRMELRHQEATAQHPPLMPCLCTDFSAHSQKKLGLFFHQREKGDWDTEIKLGYRKGVRLSFPNT